MTRLFRPIDGSWLVVLRVAFGLIMATEAVRALFAGLPTKLYARPFLFPYWGAEWIPRWPEPGLTIHYGVMAAAAFCVAIGYRYRVAAIVFFFAFTHIFLLDQAHYLNHYYLISLLALLLVVFPAGRVGSVDARRARRRAGDAPGSRTAWTVPAWTLFLFQFQIGIVYFYAGVAKLNVDWLSGQPLGMWLVNRGYASETTWVAYFLSYGGLALDLLAPFALAWRRTRVAALIFVLGFHLTNHLLFNIGVFPWLMIAATITAFFPDWIARVAKRVRSADAPSPGLVIEPRRRIVWFVVAWIAVQVLFPLRHHLYPGDVAWTEEGHKYSWRMKLRSKESWARFLVHEPATGRSRVVNPRKWLSAEQARKMPGQPEMILTFSHYLAARFRAEGWRDPEVRVTAFTSLNGRPYCRLIDPEVDLASQPFSLAPAPWIVRDPAPDDGLGGEDLPARTP